MTDKGAAEIIKVARAEIEWEYPMEYAAAFDRAIEALEQEQKTDLDQIKAEIQSASVGEWYVGRADGKAEEVVLMDDVMGIIDKYRKRGTIWQL